MTAMWQNAFDRGACTVTVTLADPYDVSNTAVRYSGSLGKGDSANFTSSDDTSNSYDLTISVDSDGRVTLSTADDPYLGGTAFDVDVAPTDMSGVIAGRLTNPAQESIAHTGFSFARSDGNDSRALQDSGGGGQ